MNSVGASPPSITSEVCPWSGTELTPDSYGPRLGGTAPHPQSRCTSRNAARRCWMSSARDSARSLRQHGRASELLGARVTGRDGVPPPFLPGRDGPRFAAAGRPP